MKPGFGKWDLDAELVFDRNLGEADDLDRIQALITQSAPAWSRALTLWRGTNDRRPIDLSRTDALREAVLGASVERGSTYPQLVREHGRPPLERAMGSVELRGAHSHLVIVVAFDEMVLSSSGARWRLGNHVSLQVRGARVERRGADAWVADVFDTLCAGLSPAWGSAGHAAEYWTKVMSDGPRIEAIGRDFRRYLPGIFWLNFFGRRLRTMVGEDRLAATPAAGVSRVDDGFVVSLANDPRTWDSPKYLVDEERVREHVGRELFFCKADPDSATTVPTWDE